MYHRWIVSRKRIPNERNVEEERMEEDDQNLWTERMSLYISLSNKVGGSYFQTVLAKEFQVVHEQ